MVGLSPLVVLFLLLFVVLAFIDTLLPKGKVPVTENGLLSNKNVSLINDAPRVKLSSCQLVLPLDSAHLENHLNSQL